jgi:hypothetical protein
MLVRLAIWTPGRSVCGLLRKEAITNHRVGNAHAVVIDNIVKAKSVIIRFLY